ncbi:MAG: TolC family protein [Myxococcaceae bacterium]|jgi:cobalt-zinc-cadmium efflux system outer membrane protein|nr:TolC family protein [Myxococcaceae bacterium]MCA3014497.1 TolC family protein [Myxococcaceae bacterium]
MNGFVVILCGAASVAPGAPLTLQQALDRAASSAPEVQVAARVLDEAEATRVGAGVFLPTNPRVFLDYRGLAFSPPMDPLNGYNLGVDGTLEVSGAGFSRVEETERRVALARSELTLAQTLARVRAYVAFVELLAATERVRIQEGALATAQRVESASRERLKNGVSGEPDVAAAALEVASVRVALEESRRLQEAARAALRQVLDLPANEPVDVEGALLEPSEVAAEDALVARAVERRPELASLKARLALLDTIDARLFREGLPRLTYNLGFDAAPASPVFGFAGLGVEVPVQRNQGPRAVAQAQRQTEKVRLETELRRVRRDVAAARRSFLSRRGQLATLTKDAVPAAERNEDLVEEGWKAGRFDIFRLTAATRELNRARRERLETLLAAWADFIELERASGGLSP